MSLALNKLGIDTFIAYGKSLIHKCVTGQRLTRQDDARTVRAKQDVQQEIEAMPCPN